MVLKKQIMIIKNWTLIGWIKMPVDNKKNIENIVYTFAVLAPTVYYLLLYKALEVILVSIFSIIITRSFCAFLLPVLHWRPKIGDILLFFLIVYCSVELSIGYFQLFGILKSRNSSYAITGLFNNPGPYGGFLAVCISILGAYYVNNKNSQINDFFSKILYLSASVIAALALVILPSTQSRSAILGLGCSLLILALATERIRVMMKPFLKKYGLWLTLGLAIIVTGSYLFKKPSADGRLFMDKICIKAMCEKGWKGAGIGRFGGAYGKVQASYFKKQIDEKGKDNLDWRALRDHDRLTADCPDNAFNEFLFIGIEAGPVAMFLFIGIIVFAIIISFKRGTIWCYGLITLAVFAMFSYPLHVLQFQVMFPILLVAAMSDIEVNETGKKSTELVFLLSTIVLLSIIAFMKGPEITKYRLSENAWKKTERWHMLNYPEYVVEDCDTLLPYMKNHERYLFAFGQSLNKTGNYVKSDSILKIGTEISSDPMFWNVMGNNSLALGKYREAEERYKHAFYMVPNRLYPLYLLAILYHTEGDTVRFLDMADRVETFIPKVESANTERLRIEIRELKEDYLSGYEDK